MGEIKLNKGNSDDGFSVIPDAPKANSSNDTKNSNSNTTYVKEKEEDQGRKLFQNKKANIALGIACGVIIVAIVGLAIFAYI